MQSITNFHGEYNFLSNFYSSPVIYEGALYRTVEHAYQAAKTIDPMSRQEIRGCLTPSTAKKAGRSVKIRHDWERVKFDIMLNLLRQKFNNQYLQLSLLHTGEAELIEGNTWGDRIWGCVLVKGKLVGENNLGKLLMKVRDELRNRNETKT